MGHGTLLPSYLLLLPSLRTLPSPRRSDQTGDARYVDPGHIGWQLTSLAPLLSPLLLQVDINMVLAVRETLMQSSLAGRLSQPLGRLDARRAIGAASGGDAEVNEALERLLGAGEQKQVRSC